MMGHSHFVAWIGVESKSADVTRHDDDCDHDVLGCSSFMAVRRCRFMDGMLVFIACRCVCS